LKNLQQIFLQRFLILFTLVFIIIGAITYYWIKDFYINQASNSLKQNIILLSYNINDLETISQYIKDDLNTRLTVINKDGKVIIESHKDKTLLDNHKNRIEIIQANKKEFGFKIRHSNTLDTDFLYIAKKINNNGEDLYIRLARKLKSINEEISVFAIKVLVILLLFFIALLFITYKMSLSVQEEINKISKFLLNLTKKRKNTYIDSSFSKELNQITKLLSKVSLILSKQDKQKEKYTNKLKLSNRQKDDIISAISHEFKNPISVINGYSQTLIEDKNINENIRDKFLQKIYKSGIRLTNLIDTLRLSIKLDEKKQKLKYQEINLEEFLKENIELIKLNYKNAEINLDIKNSSTIKADPTLFSIVIVNLIENAIKYSSNEVKVELYKNKIKVIDSGIGINKYDLENITKKFYRVSNNTWNNSLGLGLSIVSNILNQHKFKLDIKSVEHEGSTFIILF